MKRKSVYAWMGFCLVYCAGFGVPRAWGQASSAGAILGTVSDPSGAVVPEAQVTLTNTATQQARTVTTNGSGFYSAEALLAGTYRSAEGVAAHAIRGSRRPARPRRPSPSERFAGSRHSG